jgi:hypothetical protein
MSAPIDRDVALHATALADARGSDPQIGAFDGSARPLRCKDQALLEIDLLRAEDRGVGAGADDGADPDVERDQTAGGI